jgi:serine/threonine protein kinase
MDTLSLKNYRVIKKIGQGGMGVVYCAEDMRLKRLVALKFLTPHLVQEPEILKRFRAEARSQAGLVHPNITLVYAFEEEKDQAFLVLEYVDGVTLEDRIKSQGRLSPQETRGIFHDILTAMDYAHSKGLVHRDLKPSNIGFTREGVVKVMDFGIALNTQESKRLTRTGHILGTPHYMAPEQILGRAVNSRTDIYALGIALFETLTGRLPFEGDSDYAVSVAQINDPPPSPRGLGFNDIPPALEEVLFTALAKNPEERFADCRQFHQALEDAIDFGASAELRPQNGSPAATAVLGDQGDVQPGAGKKPQRAATAPGAPTSRWGGWAQFILILMGPLALVAFLIVYLGPHLSAYFYSDKSTSRPPASEVTTLAGQPKPVKAAETPPQAKPQASPQISKPQEAGGGPASASKAATGPAPKATAEKKQPVVTASLPATHKEPAKAAAPEPTPAELVKAIAKDLKEHGFTRIKVGLDKKGGIQVSGRVKDRDQREEIIHLAKAAAASTTVDFKRLTIIVKATPKPARKSRAPVRHQAPAVPDLPRKPLPPKLD